MLRTNFYTKLLTLTVIGSLLMACGGGGGGGDGVDEGTSERSNPLFDFGEESGFWTEWEQSEDVRECTRQSGIDRTTCFKRGRGSGHPITGIPYEVKGYSSSLNFEEFSKHSESLGGKLATLTYMSDDCTLSRPNMGSPYAQAPCNEFHATNYAPSKFNNVNAEIEIGGVPVHTHQSRVVYDFTDSKTTVAGLPLQYAFYNYVEWFNPSYERDVRMVRYVTLVLKAGEEDRAVLGAALDDKFLGKHSGCGDYTKGMCWGLNPPPEMELRGTSWEVEVGTSFEDLTWIEFSQRMSHTRPLSSEVNTEDL